MVISKLDKKEKEVITVIGTDTFTDSFREIRDSFLKIEQNENKFLELFEGIDFDGIKESFLLELKEDSDGINDGMNGDIYPTLEFFSKNYYLTQKKGSLDRSCIDQFDFLGFNITNKTNNINGVDGMRLNFGKGKSILVKTERCCFKVNVDNIRLIPEFEKDVPKEVLENLYSFLKEYINDYEMVATLIKDVDIESTELLEVIKKHNERIIVDEIKLGICCFVNQLLRQSLFLHSKAMSVIYDFDDNKFRIISSSAKWDFKNKMSFGNIAYSDKHRGLLIESLFDDTKKKKYFSVLKKEFRKLVKNKMEKTLTSKKLMSLNEVKNENIPINLLTDQQILNSLRPKMSLKDIAEIKKSITDEKQWARVSKVIDEYLTSLE